MSWEGFTTQLGEVKDAYLDPLFDKPDSAAEILQKIKDRELGIDWWEEETRKLKALKDLIPEKKQQQVASILSQAGDSFNKAWKGAETVENWTDPGDVVAAGAAHTINLANEGIGLFTDGLSAVAHHGLRLHKPVAGLTGTAASMYLTPRLLAGTGRVINRQIAISKLPASEKVVNVKSMLGNQIPSKGKTSAFLRRDGLTNPTGKAATEAKIQVEINKALRGEQSSVLLSTRPIADAGAISDLLKPSRVFSKLQSKEGTVLRSEVLTRAQILLKENNLDVSQYRKIRNQLSKEFNDVQIGGEVRELQSIGQALKANDASKITFPLAKTRQRGADARSAVTASAATNDQIDLARNINMPEELIPEMVQDGLRTFANVQRGAKNQSSFPGEYHSGHDLAASSEPLEAMNLMPRSRKFITSNIDDTFIPQQSDIPGRMNYPTTTGDAAGIELGVDNIRGSNKIEHSINIHAARIAGVPDNWATYQKNWWKRKQGLATKDFYSDWTNAEREIIRNIPHDWPRKKVVKFMDKLVAKRKLRGDEGYKGIIKDIKNESPIFDDFPIDELEGPMTKAEQKAFDKELLTK